MAPRGRSLLIAHPNSQRVSQKRQQSARSVQAKVPCAARCSPLMGCSCSRPQGGGGHEERKAAPGGPVVAVHASAPPPALIAAPASPDALLQSLAAEATLAFEEESAPTGSEGSEVYGLPPGDMIAHPCSEAQRLEVLR